jgi:hypothetical protein
MRIPAGGPVTLITCSNGQHHVCELQHTASRQCMRLSPHRCCNNMLTVTAMAGTDLTHTDCGVEAVFLPPPSVPAAQPSDSIQVAPPADPGATISREPAEARGLKRAMVAAVTSLDGIGKQLCLESASPGALPVWLCHESAHRPYMLYAATSSAVDGAATGCSPAACHKAYACLGKTGQQPAQGRHEACLPARCCWNMQSVAVDVHEMQILALPLRRLPLLSGKRVQAGHHS